MGIDRDYIWSILSSVAKERRSIIGGENSIVVVMKQYGKEQYTIRYNEGVEVGRSEETTLISSLNDTLHEIAGILGENLTQEDMRDQIYGVLGDADIDY